MKSPQYWITFTQWLENHPRQRVVWLSVITQIQLLYELLQSASALF